MNDKDLVAQYAASLVKDGMCVGLGTGSTANCFIEALAIRKNQDNLQITTIASSVISMLRAQQAGLPLVAIDHLTQLDLYVDGADEVSSDNTLLKGQGADLVKEKILANTCDQFIVLVDQSKLVSKIGDHYSIPVEVVSFAWHLVVKQLEMLGGKAELRKNNNGNGLAVTSHGNLVLDVAFSKDFENKDLNSKLDAIPGIVEHGVFYGLASTVLFVDNGKVQSRVSSKI